MTCEIPVTNESKELYFLGRYSNYIPNDNFLSYSLLIIRIRTAGGDNWVSHHVISEFHTADLNVCSVL